MKGELKEYYSEQFRTLALVVKDRIKVAITIGLLSPTFLYAVLKFFEIDKNSEFALSANLVFLTSFPLVAIYLFVDTSGLSSKSIKWMNNLLIAYIIAAVIEILFAALPPDDSFLILIQVLGGFVVVFVPLIVSLMVLFKVALISVKK